MLELITKGPDQSFRLSARVFGKLLHLARFHGWRPEKVPHEWPSGSWDTEIVLPHLGPYMPGPVSEKDGFTLAAALREVMTSEAGFLQGEEYVGLLVLLKAAANGTFEVRMTPEDASNQPNAEHDFKEPVSR